MYAINNICYAGELVEGIKVKEAKLLRGKMLLITFSTGEKRLFDVSSIPGSAFEPLADEGVLGDLAIFLGVMTWCDGEIDLAPENMYERSGAWESASAVNSGRCSKPIEHAANSSLMSKPSN